MPDADDVLYTYETQIHPKDLRKVWEAYEEGVVGAATGALEVTAGTGIAVDVAAGSGFVQGDDEVDQGVYRVELDDPSSSAAWTTTFQAPDGTDPRIDQVIARVYDDFIDGSGIYGWRLEVLTGTPTAGATLVNHTGAAALPDTAMRLAYVLVPAAETDLAPADIEDVRVEAREGLTAATFEAKGDLLGGTAAGAFDLLPVGTDEEQLVADSAEATGLRWGVPTTAKGVIVHGAVAGTARPAGYTSVEWIGTVEPTNAVDNDTWIDTSP